METERSKAIGQFYDLNAKKEWNRLFSDQFHQIEYRVALHYLERYLHKPRQILDAGGGPGRYTIHLANLGHQMTLVDLSLNELDLARAKIEESGVGKRVQTVAQADILNLSLFPNDFFDLTLALGGVLSHFIDETDRKNALLELSRVTKSNGIIFISVMNRVGEIGKILTDAPERVDSIGQFLHDGDQRNLSTGVRTGIHFFTPNELISLVEKSGLSTETLVSIQNLATQLREYVNNLSPQLFEKWLALFIRLSQEPSLLGISNHLLAIVKNSKSKTSLKK